jgi:hypothetical protein
MALKGPWKAMANQIPDEVVREFCAVGAHDVIAKEIERQYGGISDTVYTHHVPAIDPRIPPDLLQDIRRIPCAFKGYDTARWVA